MTGFANVRRWLMRCWFALRIDAVVAADTVARYCGMDRRESCLNLPRNAGIGMALDAFLGCRYMARWLSLDDNIIVTAATHANSNGVVNSDNRHPRADAVTTLTFVAGIDMVDGLAFIIGSAMASTALRSYPRMLK